MRGIPERSGGECGSRGEYGLDFSKLETFEEYPVIEEL